MAQWITRLPTEQKIPGSSPGKIGIIVLFHFSSFYEFIAINKTYTDPFHAKMDIIIYIHKIINVNMFSLCKGVQTHINVAWVNVIDLGFSAIQPLFGFSGYTTYILYKRSFDEK